MGNVIEASELPDTEKVYLKKDWITGEWRVVFPLKDESGKYIWSRVLFGSKSNLFLIIVLLLFASIMFFGISELISNYKQVADNPCKFCTDCFSQTSKVISDMKINSYENINISNLKLKT